MKEKCTAFVYDQEHAQGYLFDEGPLHPLST